MQRTLDQIRRDGLKALREKLGLEGMVRFLQQFETGKGDYVKDRRKWVDSISLENIREMSSPANSKKRKRTPKMG